MSSRPSNVFGNLDFLFSLPQLALIALIVSGKWMTPHIPRQDSISKQVLTYKVQGTIRVEANGAEVIVGFSLFFLTLFLVGFLAGPQAYLYFRDQYGVDPGQFISILFISYLGTAVWSFLLHLGIEGRRAIQKTRQSDKDGLEHKNLIDKLKETP